jgi:L-alanine-DL-glutamate epimerase-like enolase superfamily enzyme
VGLAVSSLLGAGPVPVPVYATTGFYRGDGQDNDPDRRAQQLEHDVRSVDLGRVRGVKIKVGRFGVADDVRRASLARTALGPDALLVLDANNAWTFTEAARVADLVADLDVLFLEEPLPFGLVTDSATLRARGRVAVGGYELEPTYEACERYVLGGAVDYVQPDATWSGGIAECVRIAELAHAHGVRTAPHNFSTAVGTAANYHAACAADVRLLETDATGNPLLDLPLGDTWDTTGGALHLRSGAGLGVTVTEEWVSAHA